MPTKTAQDNVSKKRTLRRMFVLAVLVLCGVFAALWQVYVPQKAEESAQMVETIKNARLTLADADGTNLPPMPDAALADATVEGIDTNSNGIRDEVELAIFAKYPGPENLKIRAAALQYAKALQMYLTSVFSKETLVAVLNQRDRSSSCVSRHIALFSENIPDNELGNYMRLRRDTLSSIDSLTFDISSRIEKRENVLEKYMTSYGTPSGGECDLLAEE
jgi:hypothetical protein